MSDRADGRALFDELAPEYLVRPEVAISRMFGSEALSVRGKMFAFAANDGCLVVKLPEDRIADLQLAEAQHRGETVAQCGIRLAGDDVVGLAEEPTPLRVPVPSSTWRSRTARGG